MNYAISPAENRHHHAQILRQTADLHRFLPQRRAAQHVRVLLHLALQTQFQSLRISSARFPHLRQKVHLHFLVRAASDVAEQLFRVLVRHVGLARLGAQISTRRANRGIPRAAKANLEQIVHQVGGSSGCVRRKSRRNRVQHVGTELFRVLLLVQTAFAMSEHFAATNFLR